MEVITILTFSLWLMNHPIVDSILDKFNVFISDDVITSLDCVHGS